MSEERAIERINEPNTVPSLVDDLRDLGIKDGEMVLVHASLNALGWTCGGPQAVCDALREVVTDSGTLVMPTHTGQYTEPSSWFDPSVPDEWIGTIREGMLVYWPAVTPTRGVGAVRSVSETIPT